MPMEVYGDIVSPEINTFCSPVIELVCAVHLLTDPVHHQFELKWAEDILKRLDEEDLKALETIKQYPAGGMELLNFVLYSGELHDIESFISYIKNSDILDFYFYMLNEEIDKNRIKKAFSDQKERYKIQEKIKWIVQEEELMDFFDNPYIIKERAVHIFATIYNNGFLNKYQQSMDKMMDGIKYFNSFLEKDTVEAALEKISGKSRKLFSGFKQYCIIPSYFVSPSLIRIFTEDKIYIVFDCRVTIDKKEALLEELSGILKVIDDKSRMEILRILVNGKNYGKAISDLVGISTPTVSHHLEILKQAGFVKEEKIRNIKYFYADKEKLKSVIQDINKYFFSAD